MDSQKKQRRPFIIAGAVAGAVVSGWYLCNNFGRVAAAADPIWTRFVNVSLIMFVSIYAFYLLWRLVVFLRKQR